MILGRRDQLPASAAVSAILAAGPTSNGHYQSLLCGFDCPAKADCFAWVGHCGGNGCEGFAPRQNSFVFSRSSFLTVITPIRFLRISIRTLACLLQHQTQIQLLCLLHQYWHKRGWIMLQFNCAEPRKRFENHSKHRTEQCAESEIHKINDTGRSSTELRWVRFFDYYVWQHCSARCDPVTRPIT